MNSVNLNLHFLGPQFQKSLPTDVINTAVHNWIIKWAHIQAVGEMQHTNRFPHFLQKTIVAKENNTLRMILHTTRKVFITRY
jgi:hypothetical protein